MRKILMVGIAATAFYAAPALAADIPVKAPPAPAAAVFNWTGFYIGGHIGEAWADDRIVDVDGLNGGAHYALKDSNLIYGGQVGYNVQTGQWVYGLEADFGDLVLGGKIFDPNFPTGTYSQLRSGFYGDVTGRIGLAIGNWLPYIKGGYAFTDAKGGVNNQLGGFGGGQAWTGTYSGWTIGGGVEVMLNAAWSVKVEYQHFDFGTENATLHTPANGNFRYSNDLTVNAVMVGLNYRFGGDPWGKAPVVTKY